jgi:Flp pilus assembly protein TadB
VSATAAAAALAALTVVLAVRPRIVPRHVGPASGDPPPPPRSEEDRARRSAVLVGVAAALAAWLVAPGWLSVVALPVGLVAWRRAGSLETRAARRRREALRRELPHVVDLIRALVSAGAAPDRAMAAVGGVVGADTAAELRPWSSRLLLGSDPVAVWAELARHPELGRLGTTLHRSAVGGAPVREALQRLAEDLRATRGAEVQQRVRQVEVRATGPLGACLLPAFVLVGVVPLVVGAASGLSLG